MFKWVTKRFRTVCPDLLDLDEIERLEDMLAFKKVELRRMSLQYDNDLHDFINSLPSNHELDRLQRAHRRLTKKINAVKSLAALIKIKENKVMIACSI